VTPQDKDGVQLAPDDITAAMAADADPDALPHPRSAAAMALIDAQRRPGESRAQTARRLVQAAALVLQDDDLQNAVAEAVALVGEGGD